MRQLSESQIRFYREKGYLSLHVFDSELLDAANADAERLLNDPELIFPGNLRCRWQGDNEPGTPLEALDPIIDLSSTIREIACGEMLVSSISTLLGEQAYLFKDKIVYKQPGSSGYRLHQDYMDWDWYPKTCTIALVALDASDEETGCLEVWPGYHRHGFFKEEKVGFISMADEWAEGKESVLVPLERGDVMFFDCLLPHRSAPNRSKRMRRHLYLSYNAESDGGEQRDAYYRSEKDWFKQYFSHNIIFK